MKNLLKFCFTLSLALTAYSAEISTEVLARHKTNCPQFAGDMGEFMIKEAYELEDIKSTLVILGCEMYAYNTMERAYIQDAYGDIVDVSVAEVSTDLDITSTTSLMGATFDVATKTLFTSQKGRGMGDCGSSAEYKLKSDKFALVEARIKDDCDGNFEDEWPVVYKK